VIGGSAPSEATGVSNTPATTDGSSPVEEVDRYTPLVMHVFSEPSWFIGTDGKVHLVYELELTNGFPIPVTVTHVEVHDVATDAIIETLTGDALLSSTSLLASGATATTEVPGSSIGVIWFEITFDGRAQLPAEIDHDVTVSVPPGYPVPETISSRGGRTPVRQNPPSVIGPPLVGDQWLAVGSCCDGPHRRSIQPVNGELWLAQRFAIDFNRLTPDHLQATGDISLNESWPTYDQPVIAVADAEVAVTGDHYADQTPNAPRPVGIEEADGNFVILKLDDDVYAFYAHLKPGTVAVKPGDHVTRGQVLAHTGNTGSSTGPHMHFQLMDGPSALVANGLPYVFDHFDLTGRGPSIPDLIALNPQTDVVPIDTNNAGPRTDQLPVGGDLINFPETKPEP
jgi:hypothetical protein